MAIFRQYIAPLLVVVIFLIALVAVSARIFLPSDMAAPAPIEDGGIGGGLSHLSKPELYTPSGRLPAGYKLVLRDEESFFSMSVTVSSSAPLIS
ncbi:hypothetical protein QUB80_17625 [Chlorogloeopsis sp. ULAP01]|uniref:hypothetical protein n=1 Tax=Chlorogloeopsis sp. ULAP01 TaxID=3056483 RepID=UPI0025AA5685|nr:hypothetical protein [Chlorogloeopsis sp. ULAP01]MDM9382523.1 hypothetical protein [Chlorogloeopsis sp. ULAP01]